MIKHFKNFPIFPSRDTPELKIYWVFPANPRIQTNFNS